MWAYLEGLVPSSYKSCSPLDSSAISLSAVSQIFSVVCRSIACSLTTFTLTESARKISRSRVCRLRQSVITLNVVCNNVALILCIVHLNARSRKLIPRVLNILNTENATRASKRPLPNILYPFIAIFVKETVTTFALFKFGHLIIFFFFFVIIDCDQHGISLHKCKADQAYEVIRTASGVWELLDEVFLSQPWNLVSYFRLKSMIFHTLFQTWTKSRYPNSDF